ILSLDMFTSRAFSIARRRRGFMLGSAPPMRAATVISLIRRVKTLPRFASVPVFLCWMLAHLEPPAMICRLDCLLKFAILTLRPCPRPLDKRRFHAPALAFHELSSSIYYSLPVTIRTG